VHMPCPCNALHLSHSMIAHGIIADRQTGPFRTVIHAEKSPRDVVTGTLVKSHFILSNSGSRPAACLSPALISVVAGVKGLMDTLQVGETVGRDITWLDSE